MRLLFIIPHQVVSIYKPSIDLPLGVLSMVGFLKRQAWDGEIEVYDARLSGRIVKEEDGTVFFGDAPAEIGERIKSFSPDVVGVSNMFSFQIEQALAVAAISKAVRPEAATVIGGPHASAFPQELAADENIDYVVMGEGEERLLLLLEALAKGERPAIQGVVGGEEDMSLLRANRKAPIRFLDSLDELPFPAYEAVDVERYFHLQSRGFSSRPRGYGKRSVTMLTSRGCPHQCVFCSVQTAMGYKWRHHSPDYVRRHIEHLLDCYDIDYIHFQDDNFTHDPERYDQIIDVLLSLDRPIRWDTPNGVRGDTWTRDRIRKTKASGCQNLVVAIESGVQRVIDEVVKKRLDLSQVDEFMAGCQAENLRCYAFYVMGLPGETREEICRTIDFALEKFEKYDVLPSIFKVTALPGTEVYDTAIANGYFHDYEKYRPNQLTTPDFTPEFIERTYNSFLFRLALAVIRKSLLRPRLIPVFAKLVVGYKWFLIDIFRSMAGKLAGGKAS